MFINFHFQEISIHNNMRYVTNKIENKDSKEYTN